MPGIPKEKLIEALCELAEEVDGTPTRTEMNESGKYSSQPYYTQFGSWNGALEAAGLGTNHRNTVSEEELCEELRRVAEEVEQVPRMADMDEHGKFSASAYHRRFGSWPAARKAAGLEEKTRTTRRISNSELLTALVALTEEVGRPPTQEEMNQFGQYSHRPYYRAYGIWGAALEAAGLDPDASRSRATSDEDLIQSLRQTAEKVGHTPTVEQLKEYGEYSTWPYLRAFGSYNEAVKAAGLSVNKEHGAVTGALEYGLSTRLARSTIGGIRDMGATTSGRSGRQWSIDRLPRLKMGVFA